MPLQAGTFVGPYQIVAPLGAGGMGEVYRARDTRLNRDVALKVLPPEMADDSDRLARFRREAHVLASLNHPHIAQIYGFEDSGPTHALVMELVEGPTLADRIARGPLPVQDAIAIGSQIAAALETAHEQGIVHRDLKPANVKVRPDGAVKVLDFGLAKALEGMAIAGGANDSPTLTSPALTQMGWIAGTAAYMSPEQATGKPADTRADIWAFGVVLWEMLTGRRPFAGQTVSETLASVLKDPPPIDALPRGTPERLRWLLTRCLDRDPRTRLRHIGEARILLTQPLDAPSARTTGSPARVLSWTAGAGALALAAVVAVAVWYWRPATPLPVRHLELPAAVAEREFAISPDGTRVAYFVSNHLYVRALDRLDPQDLGAMHVTSEQPFWSPDSQSIGFAADAAIRTVPAGGGPVFVVCKVPASGRVMGVAWLTSGAIVFSVWRDSLYSVPATGGAPSVRLAIDTATEIDFHEVAALPDDRLIIGTHQRQTDMAAIELLDGTKRRVLAADRTVGDLQYGAPGVLLFRRRIINEGLWAVPFGGGPLDLTKATLVHAGAAAFSAARDGTVVFALPVPPRWSLVWVDRTGATSPVPGPPVERSRGEVELSPDGHRAAFVAGSGPDSNLVVRNLDTGTDVPLTFNRAADTGAVWAEIVYPTWFPSGDRVVHAMGSVEAMKIVARRADVAGDARELTRGVRGIVSHDGRTLFFETDDRGQQRAQRAPIRDDGTLGPAQPVFPVEADVESRGLALSPDGRLLAYVASHGAKASVFLTTLPAATERLLVAEGATFPRLARDGREIFFLRGVVDERDRPKGVMMSAPITADPVLKIGTALQLFDDKSSGSPSLAGFDVAPDGRRFLMWKRVDPAPGEGTRVVLLQNWLAAVRR